MAAFVLTIDLRYSEIRISRYLLVRIETRSPNLRSGSM